MSNIFSFVKTHNQELFEEITFFESTVYAFPKAAVGLARPIIELIVKEIYKKNEISFENKKGLDDLLNQLSIMKKIDDLIYPDLDWIRYNGNKALHSEDGYQPTVKDSEESHKRLYNIMTWHYKMEEQTQRHELPKKIGNKKENQKIKEEANKKFLDLQELYLNELINKINTGKLLEQLQSALRSVTDEITEISNKVDNLQADVLDVFSETSDNIKNVQLEVEKTFAAVENLTDIIEGNLPQENEITLLTSQVAADFGSMEKQKCKDMIEKEGIGKTLWYYAGKYDRKARTYRDRTQLHLRNDLYDKKNILREFSAQKGYPEALYELGDVSKNIDYLIAAYKQGFPGSEAKLLSDFIWDDLSEHEIGKLPTGNWYKLFNFNQCLADKGNSLALLNLADYHQKVTKDIDKVFSILIPLETQGNITAANRLKSMRSNS